MRKDNDIQAIAAAETAMRAESIKQRPNLKRAVEVNKNFHFAVYEAAKSPTLVAIVRTLWLKAGPVINLDLHGNPERIRVGGAVRFHADVLKAIVKRDPAKARASIAADIKGASEFILSRGNLPD
jgi:DNA-binding GntR family transcriptional regulator